MAGTRNFSKSMLVHKIVDNVYVYYFGFKLERRNVFVGEKEKLTWI